MKRRMLLGVLALAALGLAAEQVRDIYKGTLEERVNALASIQPGLGTVMFEYGNRFTNAYYAAKSGNWALAQYELKEALEIQEVGEITRPKRAEALKSFEEAYLVPLKKAIEAKDGEAFRTRFEVAVAGCNGCHASAGYPFIRYVLPPAPMQNNLDFTLKTDPIN